MLAKLCQLWGLTFRYRGADFGASAFYRPSKAAPPSGSQLELFEPPQALDGGGLLLKLGPKGCEKPTLTVEIRLAAS